jgi:hypothetical protein
MIAGYVEGKHRTHAVSIVKSTGSAFAGTVEGNSKRGHQGAGAESIARRGVLGWRYRGCATSWLGIGVEVKPRRVNLSVVGWNIRNGVTPCFRGITGRVKTAGRGAVKQSTLTTLKSLRNT